MDNLVRKAELEEREKKRRQNNTIAMVPQSKPLVAVEKEISVSISRSSVKGAPRMYAANGRSRENSVSRVESIPEKQTEESPPLPPVVEEQPVVHEEEEEEEEGEQKEPESVPQHQQLVEVETTPATSQPQQQRNLCEGALKDCRVM